MSKEFIMGKKTVDEALNEGSCIHCVSYFPVIAPPFSSHCRSTSDRGFVTIKDGENNRRIRMCGLGMVQKQRPPSKRSPEKKKGSENVTIREYIQSR